MNILILAQLTALAHGIGHPCGIHHSMCYDRPSRIEQRYYWPVDLAKFAAFGTLHTHIEVRGQVVYVRAEADGDMHIKLAVPFKPNLFIICECTPKEPCVKPAVGADIIVRGISRRDPEHGWWEIHPVESWTSATKGE